MAQLDFTKDRAQFCAPSQSFPSGTVTVVMTAQFSKPGYGIPIKRCAKCGESWPAIAFLKSVRHHRSGYGYWMDGTECHRCDEPEPVYMPQAAAGKLLVRLVLRDETGAPIRSWDRSSHSWRRTTSVGVRRMTGTDVLRLQPYSRRNRRTPVTPVALD
jgi:hypothetical protein